MDSPTALDNAGGARQRQSLSSPVVLKLQVPEQCRARSVEEGVTNLFAIVADYLDRYWWIRGTSTGCTSADENGHEVCCLHAVDPSTLIESKFMNAVEASSLPQLRLPLNPSSECHSAEILCTSDCPFLWEIQRLSGGKVCIVPHSGSGATPRLWWEAIVDVAVPPVVDINPLLCAESGEDDEEKQLAVMQEVLDAAQEVGYFFITGCSHLQDLGNTLLRQVAEDAACAIAGGSDNCTAAALAPDRLTKVTLRSSTGMVKVSSSPVEYQRIVPPRWLRDHTAGACVEAYYAEAKRVCLLLMESLAQRDIRETDLYLMLRSVVYPPLKRVSSEACGASGKTGEESAYDALVKAEARPCVLDPHTDKSWFTLLLTSALDGLEYVASNGVAFTPAVQPALLEALSHAPDAQQRRYQLLVNMGDAFQMDSAGAFLSRLHRAANASLDGVVRVSIPLFVEPEVGRWPTPYDAEKAAVLLEI